MSKKTPSPNSVLLDILASCDYTGRSAIRAAFVRSTPNLRAALLIFNSDRIPTDFVLDVIPNGDLVTWINKVFRSAFIALLGLG